MITWRKSSRSGTGSAGGQNCVEIAQLPDGIGVRDSKNPHQANLTLTDTQFATLCSDIKAGKFSR
jgi:uncharacterized protein DUF397